MSGCTISVITVCWNAAATIRRTMESVAQQQLPPMEHIIVDGGSTDGTLEIIRDLTPQYQQRGIALRLFPQERRPGEAGITSAWNQALKHAAGDVIAIINADDWYQPAALQVVANAFLDSPQSDAVVMPISICHSDGTAINTIRPKAWWQLPLRMTIPHPGCFFHRRVYEKIGEYNAQYRLSADYDFIWRCRKAGIRWQFLDAIGVNMQWGGAATSNRAIARKETLQIARKHLPWYNLLPWAAYLIRLITRR